MKEKNLRWLYCIIGAVCMLFIGVIYAWSILKGPLEASFQWDSSKMAWNFTITIWLFCGGGIISGLLNKKINIRIITISGACIAGIGFVLTALLQNGSLMLLYLLYGVFGGFGIGLMYNAIIFCVGTWFEDKKGLASGIMMLGFGMSTLVLGKVVSPLLSSPSFGWRKVYIGIGLAILAVGILAALLLKPRTAIKSDENQKSKVGGMDCSTSEMIRTASFWCFFWFCSFLSASGSALLSFAKDYFVAVGTDVELAVSLVGIISVFNGLGRLVCGIMADAIGLRKTMISINVAALLASGIMLGAVYFQSAAMAVIGACVIGAAYGYVPTLSSVFIRVRYGTKFFASNFSVATTALVPASLSAVISSIFIVKYGSYAVPCLLLVLFSVVSMVCDFGIWKVKH